MAVTLHGDLMARVQKRVEEESKLASEPALILLQQMVEETAVVLDPALQAENAKRKSVPVSVFSNLWLQLLSSLREVSTKPKIMNAKRKQKVLKFSGIFPENPEIIETAKFEPF